MGRTTTVVAFSLPPRIARAIAHTARAEQKTKSELLRDMWEAYQIVREEREHERLERLARRRTRAAGFATAVESRTVESRVAERGPAYALTHPDMADPGVLPRIADRLKRDYHAEKVIVFGSVARGQASIHSDIDLLVVADDPDPAYKRMAKVKALVRDLGRGLPISPIVLTPAELQRRLADGHPFFRLIIEEGLEL